MAGNFASVDVLMKENTHLVATGIPFFTKTMVDIVLPKWLTNTPNMSPENRKKLVIIDTHGSPACPHNDLSERYTQCTPYPQQ